MAEAAVDTCPIESAQDIQNKNVSVPGRTHPSWESRGQKCLLLLMGLMMLGLLVERFLIYNQLSKIEVRLIISERHYRNIKIIEICPVLSFSYLTHNQTSFNNFMCWWI